GYRGRAKREDRVAEVGVGTERDLSVALHEAAAELELPTGEAAERAPQARFDPAPGLVAVPGDGPSRRRHLPHQRVGVGLAEGGGDAVLLLEDEHVARATGAPVQLDAGGEQRRVVGVEPGEVVEQHRACSARPTEGMDVAQTAAALLEVGFEHERDLAGAGVALVDRPGELEESASRPPLPAFEGTGAQPFGERGVACEVATIEQRGRGVELVVGEPDRLVDGAHRMTELLSGVPDRVPDALGDLCRVDAWVVEEQHVEVALRTQLASAVATNRDERDADRARVAGGRLEELAQDRKS